MRILLILMMIMTSAYAQDFNVKYSTDGDIGAEIQMYGSASGNGVFGVDFDLDDFDNVSFNMGYEFKRKDFDTLVYFGVGLVEYHEKASYALTSALKGGQPACPPAKAAKGKCKGSNGNGGNSGNTNDNGTGNGNNTSGGGGSSGGTGGTATGPSGPTMGQADLRGQRVRQELGARLTYKKLGDIKPFIEANIHTQDAGMSADERVYLGIMYSF